MPKQSPQKIVIALGGNALGNNLPEQMVAAQSTAKAIADLIEEGHQVVITHGNGPQVGMINLAMSALNETDPQRYVMAPLSVCVAMSQGYIGYDLQNSLREELLDRHLNIPVSTIITQVCVDPRDPAFSHPTKPIGRFMTYEQAQEFIKKGDQVIEDAGRGYRRIVPSPRPVDIIEIETVKALLAAGQVVIAGGGGGIPVIRQGNHLKGVGAVIDKDFASAKIAQLIDADYLIILTAVEKVAINYGKPNQQWLSQLTVAEAKALAADGHFAPGSMLPKIEAAMDFAASKKNRKALITLLSKAKEGISGQTGTLICQ
jgi:carbamate kinase